MQNVRSTFARSLSRIPHYRRGYFLVDWTEFSSWLVGEWGSRENGKESSNSGTSRNNIVKKQTQRWNSQRVIMFIESFSERRQPRVQQLSQTGHHFERTFGELFQPNALQKWHANCLGACISICAHHSRVIETTHWHWLCLLHFPTLLIYRFSQG